MEGFGHGSLNRVRITGEKGTDGHRVRVCIMFRDFLFDGNNTGFSDIARARFFLPRHMFGHARINRSDD